MVNNTNVVEITAENEERINALKYKLGVLEEIIPNLYDKIKSCEELLCQIWTKLKKN